MADFLAKLPFFAPPPPPPPPTEHKTAHVAIALAVAVLPLMYVVSAPRAARTARRIAKGLIFLHTAAAGPLLLAMGLGLVETPAEFDLSSVGRVSKFAWGAERMHLTVAQLQCFLGACKMAAAYAFVRGDVELTATYCVTAMYALILAAHYYTVDDMVPPAVLLAAAFVKVEIEGCPHRYLAGDGSFDLGGLAAALGAGASGKTLLKKQE